MRPLTTAIAALSMMTVSAAAVTVEDIVARLVDCPCVGATVRYEVLMPSAADPVVYTVEIIGVPAPGDTLAPCNYLIDWTLPRGERVSRGFSSYGDGVHFRYRDTKLQEYHFAEDPGPFAGQKGGVQRTAQFTDLLPRFMGLKLRETLADTMCRSSFDAGRLIFEGVRSIDGYDALEYTYRFDSETCLPIQIDMEYNPASISEQSVTAYFDWHPIECPTIDEKYVIERYADVFDRFRTSNFRVENLRGTPLPTYAGYTTDRRRVSYDRGTPLDAPALYVFLDSGVASNATTVEAVRSAVSSLPMSVNTVYILADNSPEMAVGAIGETLSGESIMISGRGLARDCGVTACPTILLVGSDGIIADTVIGSNNDLSGIVIQKMILVK